MTTEESTSSSLELIPVLTKTDSNVSTNKHNTTPTVVSVKSPTNNNNKDPNNNKENNEPDPIFVIPLAKEEGDDDSPWDRYV